MVEPAVEFAHVSKTFRLPHERRTTIKEHFLHPLRRVDYEEQRALDGVSFTVDHGEAFGIVGPNGSGKSTALKVIAGIYAHDSGVVRVNGRLSPFIELGVGFNMELTGRENIRLTATLLGLRRDELDARFDDIVAFSELDRFLDQKLKNYSSGMQVRLAFSIAIQVDFDILLLDEVLAVGDQDFQAKCYDVFDRFRAEGKTIILVSHNLDDVSRVCDRALMLEEGRVVAVGPASEVTGAYAQRARVA
jgi:ABC-type polysaccharide/polyol phosphate transport system ATPase subunit